MSSNRDKKKNRIQNKLKHSVRHDDMWHQRIEKDQTKYKRKQKYKQDFIPE